VTPRALRLRALRPRPADRNERTSPHVPLAAYARERSYAIQTILSVGLGPDTPNVTAPHHPPAECRIWVKSRSSATNSTVTLESGTSAGFDLRLAQFLFHKVASCRSSGALEPRSLLAAHVERDHRVLSLVDRCDATGL
jgi:hypothetical protein